MPQYSLLGLTPSSSAGTKKAKRPRPISKRAFLFGMGASIYAIAGLMDLISYWSNVNDEEDDEVTNDSLTESASPMAALASVCYIFMSILALVSTPSSLLPTLASSSSSSSKATHHHKKNNTPWWQKLLEDHLEVRAEYTLQLFFLIGSILLFAAEELKTHKIMRSLRKQQRASQYCFVISLHLFWLSTFGLYKIIPTESSKEKTTEEKEEAEQHAVTPAAVASEGSLEKCGRVFLIMGTTIELSMIYVEYFSQAKVSTASILMGTFVSAIFWWTNALFVVMTERYYYPDSLDNVGIGKSDGQIVDFSFEDAMNLPDRLRQRMQQAHRRHVTHIRVV